MTDDLVLARESDSSLHRQGMGSQQVHEKRTGPWKVVEVVVEGLSVVIEMEGRATRSRTVFTASQKPFYTRHQFFCTPWRIRSRRWRGERTLGSEGP